MQPCRQLPRVFERCVRQQRHQQQQHECLQLASVCRSCVWLWSVVLSMSVWLFWVGLFTGSLGELVTGLAAVFRKYCCAGCVQVLGCCLCNML